MNKIEIHEFDPKTGLPGLSSESRQCKYLLGYLRDIGAKTVVVEPHYLDRDYLAEFGAFYSQNPRGYPNHCRRLHFFSEPLDRARLKRVLGGGPQVGPKVKESYLGFSVVRPIESKLGRTVLKWYDDVSEHRRPRKTRPKRTYTAHLGGVEFEVEGLAWQQQDAAVGACATVALWSMFHSSAFDNRHAIPTTVDVRRAAISGAPFGHREFPSEGLNDDQIAEAIKGLGLQPLRIGGQLRNTAGSLYGAFRRKRFSRLASILIRSGYPVLVSGILRKNSSPIGGHAVCAVGFREPYSDSRPEPGKARIADDAVDYFYIHDDNIGPQARFEVRGQEVGEESYCVLAESTPDHVKREEPFELELDGYELVPTQLTAAVNDDVRLPLEKLVKLAQNLGSIYSAVMNSSLEENFDEIPRAAVMATVRYSKVAEFRSEILGNVLGNERRVLGSTRLAIMEKVPPMSLHIGVIRLVADKSPELDFLVDTTEVSSSPQPRVFCSIAYSEHAEKFVDSCPTDKFEPCVSAY